MTTVGQEQAFVNSLLIDAACAHLEALTGLYRSALVDNDTLPAYLKTQILDSLREKMALVASNILTLTGAE